MMPVIEMEKARLIEAASPETKIEVSVAVVTETAAGSVDVTFYVVPALEGEEYPSLVAVWDNDDDAIFDTL